MRESIKNPTRRKPSQQRSMDVVAAIRTAAAQVLVERGYARATTNRIAEAAGVSIGTLYQYFDGKDAIFDELAAHFLGALTSAAAGAVERSADAELPARVAATAEAGASVLARHPGLIRALDAVPGTSFRAKLVETRAIARAVVEQLLVEEGRTVDVATRRRARLLVSMAEGIALDVDSDDDLHFLAREITRMVVAYVREA